MRLNQILIALTLSLHALAAQVTPSNIGQPEMGFVFDAPAGAIRPVHGTPGAAILGEPLDLGFQLLSAAISSERQYALAVVPDDQQLRLIRFPGGTPSIQTIDLAMPAPERTVLSPNGSAAVLFRSNPARVQVVSGLPDSPAVQERDVTAIGAALGDMAVSDDGAVLLLV